MNAHEDEKIASLIAKRDEARKNRDFESAELIRQELLSLNIHIEDTPTGTKWQRKKTDSLGLFVNTVSEIVSDVAGATLTSGGEVLKQAGKVAEGAVEVVGDITDSAFD